MNWMLLVFLLIGCLLMMLIERLGTPVVLQLTFKGDVKRETRWLAQYGQGACTLVTALLVGKLDHNGAWAAMVLLATVFGTSLAAFGVKRLVGRVRPNHENAGRFMGLTIRHANWRESFPSSHSACAVAMTVVLSAWYPAAAVVFWPLAIICAFLRYIMDAHWPSDVLGGIALGYGLAHMAVKLAA